MKTSIRLLISFSLLMTAAWWTVLSSTAAAGKVLVIPVKGAVEPGMAAFIERALTDTASADILIFDLDTFGGRVDSALKIVNLIVGVTDRKTIAYVSNKAISAGALIALSCNELVMKRHTTIGDCAPISFSGEGPKMMGEKFQSPLRAKFRALARKNGYPEALAESMVTPEMEVVEIRTAEKRRFLDAVDLADMTAREKKTIRSRKTVVKKGELLTMDDVEARDLGFSRKSVQDLEALLTWLKLDDSTVIRVRESWSESLSRYIGSIASILLLVGLGALYIELKVPGFGAPGIIGIICLALVFLNQYLVGLADYTELMVIGLGFLLLGFEVFVIPGFGIAGVTGLVCLAVGMILAFQDFVIPSPDLPWQKALMVRNAIMVIGSLAMALIAALFFLRYLLPRFSKVVEGPYLDFSLADAHADSLEAAGLTVGETGQALTFLRPSGKARFGNRQVDVITEGEFIEKQARLRITAIQGNRIIVAEEQTHES